MSLNSIKAILFGLAFSDLISLESPYPLGDITKYQLSNDMLQMFVHFESIKAYEDISESSLLDFVILTYLYQDDIPSLKELILRSSKDNEWKASCLGIASLTKCSLNNIPDGDYFSTLWNFSGGISDEYDMTIRKIGHVLGWGSDAHAIRHLGTGETSQEITSLILYCILRYPNSYASAISITTKIPQNSKTVTEIVGAVMGAKLGLKDLPQTWVTHCKNRKYILKLARYLNTQRVSYVE